MNTGFDPDSRVVIAAYWERNHVVATQLQDNWRLAKEERITARKVQLVFKPIVFQDWKPPAENLDRYWETRRDLNTIAVNNRLTESRIDAIESMGCETDEEN